MPAPHHARAAAVLTAAALASIVVSPAAAWAGPTPTPTPVQPRPSASAAQPSASAVPVLPSTKPSVRPSASVGTTLAPGASAPAQPPTLGGGTATQVHSGSGGRAGLVDDTVVLTLLLVAGAGAVTVAVRRLT